MKRKIEAVVAKWDYAAFESAYWEPIIKRKVSAVELNSVDVAHLKAVFRAGANAMKHEDIREKKDSIGE